MIVLPLDQLRVSDLRSIFCSCLSYVEVRHLVAFCNLQVSCELQGQALQIRVREFRNFSRLPESNTRATQNRLMAGEILPYKLVQKGLNFLKVIFVDVTTNMYIDVLDARASNIHQVSRIFLRAMHLT